MGKRTNASHTTRIWCKTKLCLKCKEEDVIFQFNFIYWNVLTLLFAYSGLKKSQRFLLLLRSSFFLYRFYTRLHLFAFKFIWSSSSFCFWFCLLFFFFSSVFLQNFSQFQFNARKCLEYRNYKNGNSVYCRFCGVAKHSWTWNAYKRQGEIREKKKSKQQGSQTVF